MTMPRTQAGIAMLRTPELHTGRCQDAASLGTGCFCGVAEAIIAIENEMAAEAVTVTAGAIHKAARSCRDCGHTAMQHWLEPRTRDQTPDLGIGCGVPGCLCLRWRRGTIQHYADGRPITVQEAMERLR